MCEAEFTPSKGWPMARTAGQMPRGLSWFDSVADAHAAVSPLRAGGTLAMDMAEGENLTARAVAYSGLAALFGLPVLMLASMLLGAPLVAPAAIALGHLATSYALASEHRRSAAAINAIVLIGLVAWATGVLVAGGGTSRTGLAAVLLAPFFAAAPALARLAITPRMDRASSLALWNISCLDRLAPKEAVLVVRPDGALLAATRAAQVVLRLPAEATGRDVSRRFGLVDRPKLTDAIARCRPGTDPIEVTIDGEWDGRRGGEPSYTAEVSAAEAGAVSIRLAAAPAGRSASIGKLVCGREPAKKSGGDGRSICEVGDAVAFALRHAEPAAAGRRVRLTSEVEDDIAARCERQICRRLLFLMIEEGLMRSNPGDALHLIARAFKSVVLLRLVRLSGSEGEEQAEEAENDENIAVLRRLAEEVGGTVVADRRAGEMRLSVRLDLAVSSNTEMKKVDGAGLR
jgi:hypothetical protein